MKTFIIKSVVLVALPTVLAAITVFCAIFGICIAASRSDDDVKEPVQAPEDIPPQDNPPDNQPDDPDKPDDDPDKPDVPDDPNDPDDDPSQDEKPKKYVAFTFDDGPAYQSGLAKKYVDELAKYGGEATFFLVGDRIKSTTADGIVYAAEHGWDIGIHAYSHEYYFGESCSESIYKSEIKKASDAIHKYLPEYEIKLLRPPGGTITSERAKSSPYAIILWNVDSKDWKYKGDATEEERDENVQNIVYEVISNVQDGSIVLMHEIYNNSYLAFCEILKALDEQGYEFVSVTELLGDKFEAGKTFYNGK
ncbi:MAG: hypothetical protein E7633_07440 [Ruminococcaceae bacterium]|nr:hypothetical protein [Oscillospiraceae bacterium]